MKKSFFKSKWSIVSYVFLAIALFFTVINVVPPKKVMNNNPFVIDPGSRPMIAAHRGGKNLNPENTFKAFEHSINNYHIDILEMDLCLTSDNYLILNHNSTINASTNAPENYYVREHTLAEIQQYNFGYNFKTRDGDYPYRNLLDGVEEEDKSQVLLENDLRVVTISELLERYKDTSLKYIIEIKDDGEDGVLAADTLVRILKEYGVENKVVVGTFNDIVETHLKNIYPEIMRGGSVGAVTGFVVTQMLGVNLFNDASFCCLQIPTSRSVGPIEIHLDQSSFIDRAHRRGMAVQFWTIEDKEEMRRLIKLGADCIMTDDPDIMYELLIEMGYTFE